MIQELYEYFNTLHIKYPPKEYRVDWQAGKPVPYLVLDNFLPEHIYKAAQAEIATIPKHQWTQFTRRGSLMDECKNLAGAPILQTLTHCFNSGVFLDWLEGFTGMERIISDPRLVGAGLSTCQTGHSLKLHTDFNWNEQLHLNRAMSLILYLAPEWRPEWGGALEFWDFERTGPVNKIECTPNRLLLWLYDERFIHGYPEPLTCPDNVQRENLRLFYYSSNATPISQPHRSLYWWDDSTKTAYDDRTQK